MQPTIHTGKQGIALKLITAENYPQFVTSLSKQQQNWLTHNPCNPSSAQLVLDTNGNVKFALVQVTDINSAFIGGNLATHLPAGDYYLNDELSSLQQFDFAVSWGLGAYQYTGYKQPAHTALAQLYLADAQQATAAQAMIESLCLTRDLINTPANDMMPQDLAQAAHALANQFSAEFTQLIGDELLTQNYPLVHAVGRASEHAPRLLEMRWGNPNDPKLTLVGKGVCFDSGGLDLKPASAMRHMKKDMGGAAQVLGLASLIMQAKLAVNLRVLIPAVENAVSANAFRPGDVITSRSGISVEIDNTDAEGRLVLADAITEAVSEKPDLLVDFATLTGACRIAVGTEIAGYFSNQTKLANALQACSSERDPVWGLPLHQEYAYMLDSQVADILNSASEPYAGASTAALFLQRFVNDTPWLHFDVMAWNLRTRAARPKGGEAMGVRTLFTYLSQRYGA